FFKSKKANRFVGTIFGTLVFTPYDKWHNQHLKHHATVGNLDKRGVGDVWTMTKEEFEASDKRTRFRYKIYRNPFIMFSIGPIAVFLITNRLTYKWMTKKEKTSIWITNAALLVIFIGMGFSIGFVTFLIIQILILYFAAIAGFWLFYLQHQYEDVAWYRQEKWDFKTVALEGSSYVKFPMLLQWFSGNIGFHHIHHMNARIPNYNLSKCYKEFPVFQEVKPITFLLSMKSLTFRLWDEKLQKLVGYSNKEQ
ncbi:MAG: fatty acid desaturase, partial [Mariniphaga sp.]|nr:fatty acid desaturase [Mariniphaga sp.]